MFQIIFILYCVIWQVLLLPLASNRNSFDENSEENRVETINYRIIPKDSASTKDVQEIKTFIPKLLSRSKRNNGKVKERYRWSNATVPVQIDAAVITPKHSATIHEAMRMIENSTCVRFVNYTNQPDFVLVTSGANACKSKVGKQGGKQIMKLVKPNGGGCFGHGKILHEFLHLLGFNHFHKSPVRDDHVRIVWENVKPGYENKFDMKSSEEVTDFGTGYDFDSLVHAGNTKYSKNGNITIETVDPKYSERIGQRKKMSDGDIMRINRMYKCDEMNSQNQTNVELKDLSL